MAEIAINIPNIEILHQVSNLDNGRVLDLPEGFSHVLGGTGTIIFTEAGGAEITIDFDGIDFDKQTFSVPVGVYSIRILFEGLTNSLAYSYFPFIALGSEISISESTTSITLQGSSDYDLVIVNNQNLCGDFVGWDADGSGSFGNSSLEMKTVHLTTDQSFYYFYVHKDKNAGQNYGYVFIQYLSNDNNCNEIKFKLDPEGSKIHYFTVNEVSSSNIDLDLDSFWTIEEYILGLG
jgi:hypothetical protein